MTKATMPLAQEEQALLAALAEVYGDKPIDSGNVLYRAQFRPELERAIAAVMKDFQAKRGFVPQRLIRRFRVVVIVLSKRRYLRQVGKEGDWIHPEFHIVVRKQAHDDGARDGGLPPEVVKEQEAELVTAISATFRDRNFDVTSIVSAAVDGSSLAAAIDAAIPNCRDRHDRLQREVLRRALSPLSKHFNIDRLGWWSVRNPVKQISNGNGNWPPAAS